MRENCVSGLRLSGLREGKKTAEPGMLSSSGDYSVGTRGDLGVWSSSQGIETDRGPTAGSLVGFRQIVVARLCL